MQKALGPVYSRLSAADVWLQQRDNDIQSLRHEIDGLKARGILKLGGTWSESRWYEPGDTVTRSGGLWICRQTTGGGAGSPSKKSMAGIRTRLEATEP